MYANLALSGVSPSHNARTRCSELGCKMFAAAEVPVPACVLRPGRKQSGGTPINGQVKTPTRTVCILSDPEQDASTIVLLVPAPLYNVILQK
jgi:hypothetical protein